MVLPQDPSTDRPPRPRQRPRRDGFNEVQSRAVDLAVGRSADRVTLLQGPPGTGKTKTIVGVVQEFVRLSHDFP